MIEEGQGLRDPRPLGAAEPDDRGHHDGFAVFTMNKPVVTVVVKKRRGTAGPQGDHDAARGGRAGHGGPQHDERRPRVYQVHPSTAAPTSTPTSTPGSPEPAPGQGDPRAGEPNPYEPSAATGPWPARRRRARRDPTHAPGEVTRIVFETPPAKPAPPPAEPQARHFDFIEQAEVGYERVMAELQQLSAKLELARSARRFRIG